MAASKNAKATPRNLDILATFARGRPCRSRRPGPGPPAPSVQVPGSDAHIDPPSEFMRTCAPCASDPLGRGVRRASPRAPAAFHFFHLSPFTFHHGVPPPHAASTRRRPHDYPTARPRHVPDSARSVAAQRVRCPRGWCCPTLPSRRTITPPGNGAPGLHRLRAAGVPAAMQLGIRAADGRRTHHTCGRRHAGPQPVRGCSCPPRS